MMTTKSQTILDDFKSSYILIKAEEMAQDYEFIKGYTLNTMSWYMNLLSTFLKENEKKIDNLLNTIKTKRKLDRNNLFLKDLNFIFRIPKLIKIYNNEIEVDYVFLEENFLKVEKKQKIIELKNSLKSLDQEFEPVDSNLVKFKSNSQFNISDLYKLGSFILNLLTNREIRIKVSSKLLNSKLESSNYKFERTFNQEFIQKQKNINTWNSTESIQI